MKLDHIDIQILNALQKNSQITKKDLADQVGLSISPCWQRVKRLEKEGIITQYSVELDLGKITDYCVFFVQIVLKSHDGNGFHVFEEGIKDIPEVVECYATSGSIDYLIKIIVPNNESYHRVMDEIVSRNIGIDRYNGHLIRHNSKPYYFIDIFALLNKKPN